MKNLLQNLVFCLYIVGLWSCQTPPSSDPDDAISSKPSSDVSRQSSTPPYLQVLTKNEAVELIEQDERIVANASQVRQVLGNVISLDRSTRFKLTTDQFQSLIEGISQHANESTVVLFLSGLLEKRSLGRGRIQFGRECVHIVGFDVMRQQIVYDDSEINRQLNNNQLCTWESTEIRLERDRLLHNAKVTGFNPANNQNGTMYEVASTRQFADLLAKKEQPFVYFDLGYNVAEARSAVVISNAANFRQTPKNARSIELITDDAEAFGNRGHSCCIKTL